MDVAAEHNGHKRPVAFGFKMTKELYLDEPGVLPVGSGVCVCMYGGQLSPALLRKAYWETRFRRDGAHRNELANRPQATSQGSQRTPRSVCI